MEFLIFIVMLGISMPSEEIPRGKRPAIRFPLTPFHSLLKALTVTPPTPPGQLMIFPRNSYFLRMDDYRGRAGMAIIILYNLGQMTQTNAVLTDG